MPAFARLVTDPSSSLAAALATSSPPSSLCSPLEPTHSCIFPSTSGLSAGDMELDILSSRLRLGRIKKDKLPLAAHPLLKLLAFPEEKEQFFSITDVGDEISLILDSDFAENGFPEGVLETTPTIWRALQISPGQNGELAETVKVVRAISEPLAEGGVSIFQVSSYECDYTLVPEDQLHESVRLLKSHFPLRYPPQYGSGIDPSISSKVEQQTTTVTPSASSSRRPRKRPVKQVSEGLYVTFLKEDPFSSIARILLSLVLFPEKNRRDSQFFSFTRGSGSGVSIIMDHISHQLFPEGVLSEFGGEWSLIRLETQSTDGLGFDEVGIVRDMTVRLDEAGVSIFYLSTWTTDYLMVSAEDVNRAIAALNEP